MREAGTWDEAAQTTTSTICPYCGVGCARRSPRPGQHDREGHLADGLVRDRGPPLHQGPLRLRVHERERRSGDDGVRSARPAYQASAPGAHVAGRRFHDLGRCARPASPGAGRMRPSRASACGRRAGTRRSSRPPGVAPSRAASRSSGTSSRSTLSRTSHDPLAFARFDRGQARRRHPAGRDQPLDAGLVRGGPAASRLARREVEPCRARRRRARRAVDPAEAERLLDGRLVVQRRPCPIRGRQVTSHAPLAVAWFASSQARQVARSSASTSGASSSADTAAAQPAMRSCRSIRTSWL